MRNPVDIDVCDEMRRIGVLLSAAMEMRSTDEDERDLMYQILDRVCLSVREIELACVKAGGLEYV